MKLTYNLLLCATLMSAPLAYGMDVDIEKEDIKPEEKEKKIEKVCDKEECTGSKAYNTLYTQYEKIFNKYKDAIENPEKLVIENLIKDKKTKLPSFAKIIFTQKKHDKSFSFSFNLFPDQDSTTSLGDSIFSKDNDFQSYEKQFITHIKQIKNNIRKQTSIESDDNNNEKETSTESSTLYGIGNIEKNVIKQYKQSPEYKKQNRFLNRYPLVTYTLGMATIGLATLANYAYQNPEKIRDAWKYITPKGETENKVSEKKN